MAALRTRALHFLAPQLERILAARPLLLFRALPDYTGKTFQRYQRLTGIGPFLQLFDRDVIERLAAGAFPKQRTGNVDHVRPARALICDRRAAMRAEAARGLRCLVLVPGQRRLACGDAKPLLPASHIGCIGGAVGATAGGGVIVPGPACRDVDLEGDLAAEALAGGNSCGGCGFGHCVSSSSLRAQRSNPESFRQAVWIASLRSQRRS